MRFEEVSRFDYQLCVVRKNEPALIARRETWEKSGNRDLKVPASSSTILGANDSLKVEVLIYPLHCKSYFFGGHFNPTRALLLLFFLCRRVKMVIQI